jgi:hypothetical protein
MKKILAIALLGLTGSVFSQVAINRTDLGSGKPDAKGVENAIKVDNDLYFAPQYMPGFPTAATIYPRVVSVPCTKTASGMTCKSYNWSPAMGRGEYLMFTPETK